MRNALVTGGEGFIGSALRERLKQDGWNAQSYDIKNNDPPPGMDVRDFGLLKCVMHGYDFVFNLAACHMIASVDDPQTDVETNAKGALNVVQAAAKHRVPVVHASSGSIYSADGVPGTPYGISKRAGDSYMLWGRGYYSLPVTVLRYFSVYGPGMPTDGRGVIGVWMRAIKEKRRLRLEGGQQWRSFLYIDDCVEATVKSMDSGGGAFDVGTNEAIRMETLANMMIQRFGGEGLDVVAPRKGDDFRASADMDRMRLLGWEPKVSLDEGLDKTWEWIETQF